MDRVTRPDPNQPTSPDYQAIAREAIQLAEELMSYAKAYSEYLVIDKFGYDKELLALKERLGD